MKRLLALLLGIALIAPLAQTAQAQTFDFKTKQLVASDFGAWKAFSSTTVGATTGTITIDNPWQPTVAGSGFINPFVALRTLLVDTGAVQETITITSASCTTATVCTITATFGQAHSGRYPIRSGTFGLQEALDSLGGAGGSVIVPPGSQTTTAMIAAAIGSSTKRVVDLRSGTHVEYAYTGGAFTGGVGTAAGANNTANESLGTGIVHQTVLTFAAQPIVVTDALAYAGLEIYDFPVGRIFILGTTGTLQWAVTTTRSSTINDSASLTWSVGTVTASNEALTSTMVDLLPLSTKVLSAATTALNTASKQSLAAAAQFDGTSSAKKAFLNTAFATDTDIDADGTLTATGSITITWIDLGTF